MRLDSKLVRVVSGLTLAVAASLSASAHEDAKLLPAVKVRQTALFGVASGQVVHVAAERVAPLAVDFGTAVGVSELMGRQASRLVAGAAAPASGGASMG